MLAGTVRATGSGIRESSAVCRGSATVPSAAERGPAGPGQVKPSEKDQIYKGGSWGDNARYGQGRKELEKETRITQWNEVGDTRVGYGCCGGNKQQGVKFVREL